MNSWDLLKNRPFLLKILDDDILTQQWDRLRQKEISYDQFEAMLYQMGWSDPDAQELKRELQGLMAERRKLKKVST